MPFTSEIKTGVPNPRWKLSETTKKFAAMKSGDYLETDLVCMNAHTYAKRAGVRITTKKQDNGLLGVWCLGKRTKKKGKK